MLRGAWRQRTAKTVLVAFGASSLACGGSPTEAPATSTTSTPGSTTLSPPTTVSLTDVPDTLSDPELRKLVAPVALYPDIVLASLLPATTYPEQLHDAALWIDDRSGSIDAVPEDRDWDGSVAGLLQFPDVLRWADENEPWTDEMGSAMTYQQGDVLSAIQDYRSDVAKAGNLESNAFHTIVRDDDDIRIQQTKPDTVYVPHYDPVAATQPQVERQGVNPWIAFGGGVLVGALGAWALYSIFDDDDDRDHRRRRRRVKRVNNYYYSGQQKRPPAEIWTPRQRRAAARRTRRAEVFEPKPLQPIYATARQAKPGKGHGGVRPPASDGKNAGTRKPGKQGNQGKLGKQGKQKQGKQKQGKQKQGKQEAKGAEAR